MRLRAEKFISLSNSLLLFGVWVLLICVAVRTQAQEISVYIYMPFSGPFDPIHARRFCCCLLLCVLSRTLGLGSVKQKTNLA